VASKPKDLAGKQRGFGRSTVRASSKSEARDPKQIQIPKTKSSKQDW